ncbi:carbohydrate ABC transporter permease [Micromonospora globbae]|uniref:carbohydrate ABC transporter permease n=1 Tax=Micromonospora globbae TaxID=1894969 RepID=UPI00341AAD9E
MTLAPAQRRETGAVAAPAAAAPRRRRWQRHRPRTFYIFISPWLVGLMLLTVFPLGYALWLSITNYDGVAPKWSYVGLDNYRAAFTDPQTWESMFRTFGFVLVLVPVTTAVGLFLAVLVNQRVRGKAIFRAIFFLPVVVPVVAAGFTFRMMFDRDSGLVTAVIDVFGGHPIEWLADDKALLVMLLMIVWRVGNSMVISLAGLQGVPRELHEAAAIDGASTWRTFSRITIPLLSPVLFFQVVIGVIDHLQIYLPALLLASAGQANLSTSPGDGLYVYMVHVYAEAFSNGNLGYASALLFVLAMVTVIATLVIFRASRRMVYYESGPGGPGEDQ